ncbi:MAG: hypothetical protein EXR92_04375 [Gemmatimonadetes bacterium]|nr:hypothetical protein [Gemmatimonadota bacterium]
MSRLTGAGGVLVVLVMVMFFARWNGAERVTLDLGFHTFFRVPFTYVAFGGLFIGMLVMLVAGIHSDLKVRRFLRERLEEEDREERRRIDRHQQDLFSPPHSKE